MALLVNSPHVFLRDALEVVPLFDESKIPLSHFIEGCYEAKAILPQSAANENLAWLLRSKVSGEARKCIFESTYNTKEELIDKIEEYMPLQKMLKSAVWIAFNELFPYDALLYVTLLFILEYITCFWSTVENYININIYLQVWNESL